MMRSPTYATSLVITSTTRDLALKGVSLRNTMPAGRCVGVSDEVFMVLWLDKAKAGQVSGLAIYRDEFNEAG